MDLHFTRREVLCHTAAALGVAVARPNLVCRAAESAAGKAPSSPVAIQRLRVLRASRVAGALEHGTGCVGRH